MIEGGAATWTVGSAGELAGLCAALRGLGAPGADEAGMGVAGTDVAGTDVARTDVAGTTGQVPGAGSVPGARSVPGAAELVDQIRRLEELKAAAAAAQARVTARLAAVTRAARRAAGVPAGEAGAGIGAQVALARRDSPHRGSRHLGVAEALCHELPHTLAALAAGQTSEWRATLVVRETACLSREHRGQVDAELAARPGGLGALGDRAVALEARRIAYRLDPHAATDRAARAAKDRRVTLRPAPDTMGLVTGLLPVQQAVAAYAALSRHADSRRAQGDQRSRGQIMADTFVERLTGQAHATGVPVEVNLVMREKSLLRGGAEPGDLDGYGPVPAPLARDWLRAAAGTATTSATASDTATPGPAESDTGSAGRAEPGRARPAGAEPGRAEPHDAEPDGPQASGDGVRRLVEQAQVWLRRLYTAPDTGALVAMDSTRRCFDGQLRRFVIARDRRCRTPWCDAPIRHVDHLIPVSSGGATTAANSQGLCEACNYTKNIAGWRARPVGSGTVEITTPTGHTYLSHAPPGEGRQPPQHARGPDLADSTRPSCLEAHLALLLHAA